MYGMRLSWRQYYIITIFLCISKNFCLQEKTYCVFFQVACKIFAKSSCARLKKSCIKKSKVQERIENLKLYHTIPVVQYILLLYYLNRVQHLIAISKKLNVIKTETYNYCNFINSKPYLVLSRWMMDRCAAAVPRPDGQVFVTESTREKIRYLLVTQKAITEDVCTITESPSLHQPTFWWVSLLMFYIFSLSVCY